MNLLTAAFSKIFKSGNQQVLDKIKPLIVEINNKEKSLSSLKNEEFKEKTHFLRKQVLNGVKLENLIPDSFSLVREAAKRVLGERHFDVQLAGGVILHQGKIAEMKTGEGKTLVSTLPAYLNSLSGKGVHIVTVNDYLAKRDSEWMGKVFNFLGASTGCITSNIGDAERKKVIGMRFGESCDLHYWWYYKNKRIKKRISIPLDSGDIYIMNEKACGNDWKNTNIFTLRHATGCDKYVT